MNTLSKANRIDLRHALAAVLLLCLLMLSTLDSIGFTRSGFGEEEDEGSGIGGTGIRGLLQAPSDFGGSGFGGTGRKPFLGVVGDEVLPVARELELDIPAIADTLPPAQRSIPAVTHSLVSPILVSLNDEALLGSTAQISIDQAIQRTIDINAYAISSTQAQLDTTSTTKKDSEPEQSADWQQFSRFLAEESPTDNFSDAQSVQQRDYANLSSTSATLIEVSSDKRTLGREARNRVQRPVLPPIQRVRAIERPSILPPRIQPMKI